MFTHDLKALLGLDRVKSLLGLSDISSFPDELTIPNSGSCVKDTIYVITGYDDLVANINDLECIFHAGEGLVKPPVGAMYGQLLLAVNSEIPRFFANSVYQGDYGYTTSCYNEDNVWTEHFVSQLRISPGIKLGVSVNTTSPYPSALRAGEVEYALSPQRGSQCPPLVMDFTVNTNSLCPVTHTGSGKAIDIKNSTMDPFGFSAIPVNGYVDFGVLVGSYVNEDGRTRYILLNKAMAYDDSNDEFSTILYYTVEFEDPNSIPSVDVTTGVTVPYNFEYTRPILPPPESIVYSLSKAADALFDPKVKQLRNKVLEKHQ